VKIFKTDANIFVPTGFTPNSDSKNDVLKPILVGMKKLERFSVYNRWGQLVFSTSEIGKGWDGKISGADQKADVYVYVAIGITYLDQKIVRKGTTTLIR
jgi:gliding motility-associated-like protein